MPRYEKKPAETEIDTAGKTETFWTRHIRLIAFITGVVLFFAVFVPIALWGPLNDWLDGCDERNDWRAEMTLEDLEEIAAAPRRVTERYLDRFKGEKSNSQVEAMKYINYQIYIGERYFLMASLNAASGEVLYLVVTDFETGDELNLLTDGKKLDSFLGRTEN